MVTRKILILMTTLLLPLGACVRVEGTEGDGCGGRVPYATARFVLEMGMKDYARGRFGIADGMARIAVSEIGVNYLSLGPLDRTPAMMKAADEAAARGDARQAALLRLKVLKSRLATAGVMTAPEHCPARKAG
jgi:hypothetical protein